MPKLHEFHASPVELASVLAGIVVVDPKWDRKITGVTLDSRAVASGDLFIACKGGQHDARLYIHQAIEKGAIAVIASADQPQQATKVIADIPVFYVEELTQKVGRIAARFYSNPSRRLHLIGITGTNGKTSTSHYIAQALQAIGKPCAVIGTLGYGLIGDLQTPTHTTPDAIKIQHLLASFCDSSVEYVTMEVTSHALDQGRVRNLEFTSAVFTNLTRDHLDYHGTMERYGQAKLRLFQQFGLQQAIVNLDDPFSKDVLAACADSVQRITYAVQNPAADVRAEGIQLNRDGMVATIHSPWGSGELRTRLYGRFNLANLLVAIAVLGAEDHPFNTILSVVSQLQEVPGRMQCYSAPGSPLVVVDYSHTPDALSKALQALREHCQAKLWCVFGCGGDRDQGKRPQMGAIAEQFADHVIVTNDNPRFEQPEIICQQILAGFKHPEQAHVDLDRASAIRYALRVAASHDVVLIAGKGHERYQIIADKQLPFDDRDVVAKILSEQKSHANG